MDRQKNSVEQVKVTDRQRHLLGKFRFEQIRPGARNRQICAYVMVDHEYCSNGGDDRVITFRITDMKAIKVRIDGSTTDILKYALIFKAADGFVIEEGFKPGGDENVGELVRILNAADVVGNPVSAHRGGFEFVADLVAGPVGKVFDEGIKAFQQW